MKNALSIAGVDPSGGAGIIADLKVFIAHKVYAMGVVTATTAQNTKGLYGMQLIDTKLIKDGINAIFDDIKVDVIKIGVVPSVEIIKTVADTLKAQKYLPPVVLDPVMSCKNGDIWLEGESKNAIVKELFPLAKVITPNRFEATEILGFEIKTKEDAKKACIELLKYGPKSVFLKAGEIDGASVDVFYDGEEVLFLETKRLNTDSTHGSGCSLSSAIASNLANGDDLKTAVKKAEEYIFNAIKNAFKVGSGCNPVNHFYNFY
ncbi:hydroxymethylpyrimidine kinase / phosphohydroxymethylpyrimidine kinase [Campylobacter blaseri]|uniref:hydroxymethylpyrimidine kinase n=1 Tax=Campylobacter blaseri TaxID=2042961 RepID=A0A2P8QZS9_9BACT|nr:bifunctional hydroxymethylpyrimidine kinase/phosphomethylpyrimidine kinase [Campylobacter blaseri]PSM51757.1 bifunctional hydroxymethylpyrimidine kinase/phosphomethylpyrimidine kinase [Campylobacter blaseri]PSM53548.1 bifunctional hydroxymethylpyrimidine kinase/phosphomethylpyrimidine kinase [Campylobacter blaseri]QKF86355.1 hydroxymethylpyrimidine kinase / phosphohydroxymethylpyrimidine kinase [Campylobacter blaseri]